MTASSREPTATQPPFPVLYEDNHLLVVNKPAGLAVMGVAAGRESILTLAAAYVKRKYAKPGNVYLGVVSRLDAPVTGALVLARTSKAASRLTEQFRGGAVDKRYWALVSGAVEPPEGECLDWLGHDERHRRVRRVRPEDPQARRAELRYRTLARSRACSLLEVQLLTGRKHQIRVQLSALGHPILGDRKYGASTTFPDGIALHARLLGIAHPVGGAPLRFEAPLPDSWRQSGVAETGQLR
jgi:23S rRNA pseudouridine1911/1915/1917 synthase